MDIAKPGCHVQVALWFMGIMLRENLAQFLFVWYARPGCKWPVCVWGGVVFFFFNILKVLHANVGKHVWIDKMDKC